MRENRSLGFPTRSDTNWAGQSKKIDRGWKFWIKKVEELYYPCSENKGADQLRSYCEADLRLCFRLCRLLVFPCGGSCGSTAHSECSIILNPSKMYMYHFRTNPPKDKPLYSIVIEVYIIIKRLFIINPILFKLGNL